MGISKVTKQELFLEIEQLPNPYLYELQDFIQYLKFKQSGKVLMSDDKSRLKSEQDPILSIIGMCDVTPFSDTIDDELYGVV